MNRKIKKKVLALLAEGDLGKSRRELAEYDEHGLVNPLFSALYRPEEMLRWHTVTVFGEVLARLADKDMEAARIIMRRYIWSLNDESGGIGWGAPEAMAEAMYHHDGLCDEYLHMLISYMRPDGPLEYQDGNFLELPALQRGLLWGICRLAEKRRSLLLKKEIISDLFPYLESS
ncbi:MAG TPA: HEAT repeat domain-containing protein, partial [Desulfocapsa sulfexigens]|nr:HEAT repeat domain-containing protein [Desulfocapsa sulfexigens]